MEPSKLSKIGRALDVVGRGGGDVCPGSIIQAAREHLDKLEADLAAEEWRQAEERTRLVQAWVQLHETVEACRKDDVAVREQREKARREAKEIREGVINDAEEILVVARGKLEEVESREEALEEETKSKHAELHDDGEDSEDSASSA